MRRPGSLSGKQAAGDRIRSFREQALDIIKEGLEEVPSQHPLDVPEVFEYDRPTLDGVVPVRLFRAVRLLAFREVLGSRISAAVLNVSGRSVARKLGIRGVSDLVSTFEGLSVGRLKIEEETKGGVVLTAVECATCSGLPNIGEPLCHFETGLIAGGLEEMLGRSVKVSETQCWGLGDGICRWEARRAAKGADSDSLDHLELMMTLAGKAALAMENSVAIRQKNRELRKAYDQLSESERLKKDLTAMVVHDMRVPLTAVMGSIETLAEMMGSRFTAQEEGVLNIARSSGHTLLQMINDLLDISRLEEREATLGKLRTSPVRLIEQAVCQAGVLVSRKELELEADIPPDLPDVSADRERIVRVLVNLLSNAVRHTPSGGRITIAAAVEPDGKAVSISVKDTGEGIPRRYHRKIFDKFFQVAPGRSRGRLSTGLGLTFCKLVVEAHKGRIWVESEPGAGSTFTFTLPLR